METMTQENLFQSPCTFAIYFYFIQEVVFAFIGGFQHGCKCVLRRVAGSGRKGVHKITFIRIQKLSDIDLRSSKLPYFNIKMQRIIEILIFSDVGNINRG